MSPGAPTNNYLADIDSVNATITEVLTLPLFGGRCSGDTCSPLSSSSSNAFVDRLQHAISSMDLSFNIPDHRELSFFGYSLQSNTFSGKYSASMPDVKALLGVQLGISVTFLIGILFATILYRTVISSIHGKNQHSRTPRQSMVGLVLFLSCIFLPYPLIDALGAQSTAIRFPVCACFVLYMFRTLEAIFDFVPTGAKSSVGVYCVYFSLPFDMVFDEQTAKPIMATKRDIFNGQINIIKAVACMSMLCSILSPYGYVPFGETSAGEFHRQITVRDYLDIRHLGNCFAIAIFFQQGLVLGEAAIGNFVQIVFGYKTTQMMRNPMLEATSPSDFWGKRWNVLVHSVMKRGVYKPVRKYSSAVVASLAVFVASGLFHEWLVHVVILYNQPLNVSTSEVFLGSNSAFFIWNFFVIVSERILAGTRVTKSFGKMIPSVFLPFLIIMTSLPMAHWFGNPYLKGGFFSDYEQYLVLIRKEV